MMRSGSVKMDVLDLINKRVRRIVLVVGAGAVLVASALLGPPAPAASADPCPDVEVLFARGSGEPPGVGNIGQQFVDALSGRIGGRSLGVYQVNYGAPPIVIGPLYNPKTLELCTQGDPICGAGNDNAAHVMYAVNGMTNEAADFAAGHL